MNGQAEGAGAVAALAPDPALAVAAAAAASAAPHIAQLNVSQRSQMHIGPKFVSVTQNVHSVEVVKGRALGLELQASARAPRRLRCSVAVCVCWALMVAGALAAALLCALLLDHPALIDLGLADEWYLRRGDWQALPAFETTFLRLPVRYAMVGHSAGEWCDDRYRCIEQVLLIQSNHQRLGWSDIGPNFLVSGNGLVFEGRGANLVGAMVQGWNSRGVSIMFLGDYRHDAPTAAQLRHVAALLEALVAARVLAPDYQLLGHCQLKPYVYAPGALLLDQLHFFPHWNSVNRTMCLH